MPKPMPSRAAIMVLLREIKRYKKFVPHIIEAAWGISDRCDAARVMYETADKVEKQMKGEK